MAGNGPWPQGIATGGSFLHTRESRRRFAKSGPIGSKDGGTSWKLAQNRETPAGGTVVDRDMRKLCIVLLVLAFAAWGANVKLYLTDGTYQVVREYQVKPDRVRYYSVERSDWEEIPLEMVDLKRTESEVADRKVTLEKEEKIVAEENAAEREVKKEASRIPQDPGVYWVDGKETKVLKVGEVAVHSNKGRSILQKLSPIPAITGKATLEMTGAHSANIFTDPEQEFYIQLSDPEGFGIAKLTTKGAVRIVENLTYNPIDKTMVDEERSMVEILHRQVANDLYKIWPRDPLPPGEYAVVQYTDGKVNIQVFDFAIKSK
jgi:hypothetical protein